MAKSTRGSDNIERGEIQAAPVKKKPKSHPLILPPTGNTKKTTAEENSVTKKLALDGQQPSRLSNRVVYDILRTLKENKRKAMGSKEIVAALCADPESQWNAYPDGKKLNLKSLAALLKVFDIKSKPIKMEGKSIKGYKLEWFRAARKLLKVKSTT